MKISGIIFMILVCIGFGGVGFRCICRNMLVFIRIGRMKYGFIWDRF